MRKRAWTHIARTAAALAAAMGIGRFAFTPILPLMTAQAHLAVQSAGQLATANYLGYLVGAVAGAVSPRLARSVTACRWSLVVLVASLVAMACTTNVIDWLALRLVAGITSALVFVIAVNVVMDHLHGHPAHLPGWAFGGVGVGIALSAALVFVLPTNAGWRAAWWSAAALAAVLSAAAWSMRPVAAPVIVATPNMPRHNVNRPFALLFGSYTLEGIGYIIAGTFLVAAVAQHSPGWLGNGAWLVVGLAADPVRGPVGRPELPVPALGTAVRRPASAGGRDSPGVHRQRCGGPVGSSSVRRHLHRGEHAGPGGRPAAAVPERRRVADGRLLRRTDHRAGGSVATVGSRVRAGADRRLARRPTRRTDGDPDEDRRTAATRRQSPRRGRRGCG